MRDQRDRPAPGGGAGPSRRDVLRAGGGLAALACWPMVGAVAARAAGAGRPGFGRADSCLIVFLGGGPSHLDTFDPKPDAPAEFRGEFGAIATAAPELRLGEHLPMLAKEAGRFAVVRSLTHEDDGHEAATHRLLTGRALDGPGGGSPHVGSALAASASAGSAGAPPFVAVPDHPDAFGPAGAGLGGGPLGGRFDPIVLRAIAGRLDFRGEPPAWDHDDLLRVAVDLGDEPPRVAERYGRGLFGRSMLLGRRLVEAGVPVVQVNAVRHLGGGWDAHVDGFATLRDHLLPAFDRAASALLADLGASGRLDRTLVIVAGEFGRTPRVNRQGGRDHWPRASSALVAGAGIPGGRAFGVTDAIGAEPVDRPVAPEQLAATIRHALGRPEPGDRPVVGFWDEAIG